MAATPPPIDGATFLKAQVIVDGARRQGRDPVEALHRQGLILTPRLRQDIAVGALRDLIKQMDEFRAAEFLRINNHSGTPGTPAEMLNAVREFLARYVNHVKKEGHDPVRVQNLPRR